ncbi:hypothetical protein [Dyadobacter diqingensis]|uniref:hypothetical protein n=1 Tax=Dyadobacter diqingensis TaxID=2938121 RepID=UPI0020C1AEFE|nr:hypothetical protein [Dyadobacter diqingensis]
MKISKNQSKSLFLILLFIGSCKKDSGIPRVPLLCTWPADYHSGEIVENYSSEVFLKDTTYVLSALKKIGDLPPDFLYPCNMPEEEKKEGLKVIVSGHVVRFKDFDSAVLLYGYPFEITSIEYVAQ